jgi:hypothetical protein
MEKETDFELLKRPWDKQEFVPNYPDQFYHNIMAISSGRIKTLLKSPAHFLDDVLGTRTKPTPAMIIGSNFHMAALEGESFLARLVIMPDFSGKGSRAEKDAWLDSQMPNAIIVDQEDRDTITRMLESLLSHPRAAALISGQQDQKELSGFFNHDSLRCKMRADIFRDDVGAIVDLKTCLDASPSGFMRAAWDMKYYIQASWYLLGASAISGKNIPNFVFVAIEKTSPYAVTVFNADDAFISAGDRLIEIAIGRLKRALDADIWPAYGDSILTLSPPHWGLKQIEDFE